MIFCVILLILLLLSYKYDIQRQTNNKTFCYNMMLFVFILVAGLRWRIGIDTPVYLYQYYHDIPTLDNFSWSNYSITESPLYLLIASFVKTIGGRFFIVQIIQSSIVNVLIFRYIKKHSQYLFTCLFFYTIVCYTTYNMEIMRGSLSIVICLYANDYILNKKWVKGYLLYLLSVFFHAQSILMFILPLLYFLRFNKSGLVACVIAFLMGTIIMNLFGDYMFVFETNDAIATKIDRYSNSGKYGTQAGNINFFIVQIFPLLFYSIFSTILVKRKEPNNKLLKLEPLVLIGVLFILIRMNLEIAYRYVDFFKIYFVLFISESFILLAKGLRTDSKILALLRSYIIFVPFFLVVFVYNYMLTENYSLRYTPYSTIIDREVSREREMMYQSQTSRFYPLPSDNEY